MGVRSSALLFLNTILTIMLCIDSYGQKNSLPGVLSEASGLAIVSDTAYWVNDSGNPAQIISTDLKGNQLEIFETSLTNIDWESLDSDEQGNLYIADVGNNANTRRVFTIYRWNRLEGHIDSTRFYYQNQSSFPPPSTDDMIFDCEAVIVTQDTITLFSKNNMYGKNRKVNLYRFPFIPDSIQGIVPSDSADIGDWVVTGAAIHPGKEIVVLIAYRYSFGLMGIFPSSEMSVTFLYDYPGNHFFKGRIYTRRLPTWFYALQYEAVDWINESTFMVGSEKTFFTGPKIRKFKLTKKERKILGIE